MASQGGYASYSEIPRIDRSRLPVSRGMLSGGLLVLLGLWGGLIPFIGPLFDYAYTPDSAWTWTLGRLWLEVLPAAAAVLGGLIVAGTTSRTRGIVGGWLAAAAGAWFIIGPSLSRLWTGGPMDAGSPTGDSAASRVLQEIGFFYGLGAVILFLAALTIGRFSALGLGAGDTNNGVDVLTEPETAREDTPGREQPRS